MPVITPEISDERAQVIQWAVDIIGGQRKAAGVLRVTPSTVSRWTRAVGPVPESVIMWAKSVINTAKEEADKL